MDTSAEIRQRKNVSATSTTNNTSEEEGVKKSLPKSDSGIPDMVMSVILFLVSLPIRFKNLSLPSQVIFDEGQVGKLAGYYIKHAFFFDVHPPVSKSHRILRRRYQKREILIFINLLHTYYNFSSPNC